MHDSLESAQQSCKVDLAGQIPHSLQGRQRALSVSPELDCVSDTQPWCAFQSVQRELYSGWLLRPSLPCGLLQFTSELIHEKKKNKKNKPLVKFRVPFGVVA